MTYASLKARSGIVTVLLDLGGAVGSMECVRGRMVLCHSMQQRLESGGRSHRMTGDRGGGEGWGGELMVGVRGGGTDREIYRRSIEG